MRHFYAIMAMAAVCAGCASAPEKEPVDYVNPYIGNISHLLVPTYPTTHLPNSMLRVYPVRGDYTSEYVNGLPIAVIGHRGGSAFGFSANQEKDSLEAVAPMDYDNETITPYSYDTDLDECSITVHFAPSHKSAIYEIVFNNGDGGNLQLMTRNGSMEVNGNSISGYQTIGRESKVYIWMETQESPLEEGMLRNGQISDEKKDEGRNVCAVMRFKENDVHVRYGISFISCEQAKANLHEEIKDYDVKALAEEGRGIWNEKLGRLAVSGGTEDQKAVFYTSYYRTLERPICISEDGKYWSGEDSSVHEDGGTPYYTDDWIWDTYRAQHPLRTIMDTEIEEDILASFIRMAHESGHDWAPTFPEVSGDSRSMNCNHTIASFADAIAKGRKIETLAAYEISRKTLLEKTLLPWTGAPATVLDEFYWKNGYMPALRPGEKETIPEVHSFEKRQTVAVTLGTSYDSWCASLIAEAAGHGDTAAFFRQKSLNYRNIFNSETAFFHPKDEEGNFIEPMDYSFPDGMGGRDYYDENNAWVYRWDVQHNFADLVSLMSGNEKFVDYLDQMYATPLGRSKYEFYSKFPDHTGNVGQFSMANEPSMHIPYLYNYAGAPWKTQKCVRQMLDMWFRNDLMGIPGDEDGGGLTSFVVFSSMGIYPVTPGIPVYNIGSPIFEDVKITASNGNIFEIEAQRASKSNKYIQSATLNGKALDKPWISHEDIMKGGKLTLVMGSRPNKEWGKDSVPPSMK
jgi:predicted alpha-1,2-mannosidase